MLSKIVNKQYNQPYLIFDAFNKLENNKFHHLQQSWIIYNHYLWIDTNTSLNNLSFSFLSVFF